MNSPDHVFQLVDAIGFRLKLSVQDAVHLLAKGCFVFCGLALLARGLGL
jgi:hypothetical protein